MRTITEDTVPMTTKRSSAKPPLRTLSTTLTDGRVISIREMTGRDLLYMEKELSKEGDVEKGMRMIERLIVGDEKITYEEVLDLGVRDFQKLSELVAKASEDDSSDPK